MNKVIVTGRIANDIELEKTQSGTSRLNFNLAIKRDRKNQNGETVTDFIRICCWTQNAEYLSKYAKKGTKIGVSGRIETNNYTDLEGKKIYSTYITAESVEILNQPKEPEFDAKEDVHKLGGSRSDLANSVDLDSDNLPFY